MIASQEMCIHSQRVLIFKVLTSRVEASESMLQMARRVVETPKR